MSFGKSKSKTSQQQTTQNTLNPWSQQQWETQTRGMQDAVNAYTSRPFNPYTGNMVAGMTGAETQARDMIANGTFDPSNVSKYYNPYERDVVDAAGAYMDQQLQGNLSQNNARATQAGAFGGSRHGVADAELMRSNVMDKANMMANLRYQGYNNAQNIGFQDAANRRADAGLLAQMGANEREIEQARLLAQRAEFDRQAEEEYRNLMLQLQTRQTVLGSTPLLTNSSSQGSGTSSTSSFQFAPQFDLFGGALKFGGSGN